MTRGDFEWSKTLPILSPDTEQQILKIVLDQSDWKE